MQYSVDKMDIQESNSQICKSENGYPYDDCLKEYIIDLALSILSGDVDIDQFIDYSLLPESSKTLKLEKHNVPNK